MYSLTMYGRSDSMPVSRICAVQKAATRLAAATSRRKRSVVTASPVRSARIHLTATGSPVGPMAW